MNEVDAGRDRATPASVRHVDDDPLTHPHLSVLLYASRWPAHLLVDERVCLFVIVIFCISFI